MSEPTPTKLPAWTFALLLLPVLALFGYTYFRNSTTGSSSIESGTFDPSRYAELEIKGATPEGSTSWTRIAVPPVPPRDEKLLARGKELYSKACAACHGDAGAGDGLLVARLNWIARPANLAAPIASIKLRSTEKGTLPTDDDLFRTLTRGLPGTPMLSFRNLPDADRWALVQCVKEFSAGGRKMPEAKPLAMPAAPPRDDALILEGEREFNRWCANCHGPQGLGGTSSALQMEPMYPGIKFARNGGTMMLRGATTEDIALTLLAGSSGNSPMMTFRVPFYGDEPNASEIKVGDRKLWATAFYVRKLIEDGVK